MWIQGAQTMGAAFAFSLLLCRSMSSGADSFFRYADLQHFLQQSPAVRQLRSNHAAMTISFLYRVFRAQQQPSIPLQELTHKLADYLSLIGFIDDEADPSTGPGILSFVSNDYYERADLYIKRWAGDDNRYIYINLHEKTHEPYATLSRYTEKVFMALDILREKEFIGTESKLLDLFGKVQELVQRTNSDPEERIKELQQRKRSIDEEIKLIRKTGEVPVFEPWQIKSRWADIERLAAELSGDFREVEENFKEIYRTISRKHADATLSKGQLLRLTFDALEELRSHDQGRSFYAFWEFLMDESRQQALQDMLQQLYDLLEKTSIDYGNKQLLQLQQILHRAGIKVLQTNELLGYKLSRIVVEKEKGNRRKTRETLHKILQQALQQIDKPDRQQVAIWIDDRPAIALPMERKPGEKPVDNKFGSVPQAARLSLDQLTELHKLMDDGTIDKGTLQQNISTLLRQQAQVSLPDVVAAYPCTRGLAELLSYVSIATFRRGTAIHPTLTDDVLFDSAQQKYLQVPRIIFTR